MTLVALLAVAAALVSCSPAPESRLEAYAAEAQDIHAQLLARLPDDLEGQARTTSRAWIDESEWAVPRERQVAHWTTESIVPVAGSAAADAAAAIGAHLRSSRWEAESVEDPDGSAYEVYRLPEDGGEWIVEVARREGHPLRVMVQSPVTVRGADEH